MIKLFHILHKMFLDSWSQLVGACMGVILGAGFVLHHFTFLGGFIYIICGAVILVALITLLRKLAPNHK